MARMVVALILAILLMVFASQNMHETEVRVVFGPSIELPLILIISVAFVFGFSVAIFAFILRGAGSSREKPEYRDDDY